MYTTPTKVGIARWCNQNRMVHLCQTSPPLSVLRNTYFSSLVATPCSLSMMESLVSFTATVWLTVIFMVASGMSNIAESPCKMALCILLNCLMLLAVKIQTQTDTHCMHKHRHTDKHTKTPTHTPQLHIINSRLDNIRIKWYGVCDPKQTT